MAEYVIIGEETVEVPAELIEIGRDHVQLWHDDAGYRRAIADAKEQGVALLEIERTGEKGALTLSDIHRGISARRAAVAEAARLAAEKAKQAEGQQGSDGDETDGED